MSFLGMFGKSGSPTAAQQVARGGDGIDPSTMPQHNGLFGDGSVGGIATGIGKLLMYGPFAGVAQDAINRKYDFMRSQQAAEGARQLQIAQYKANNPEPSDIMREAQSMGLQPGTPQWNDFIRTWRMKQPMIVLGSPALGQQVVDPSQLRSNVPPPPAIGEVQDGHVYMGGDPSLPTSWRAQ